MVTDVALSISVMFNAVQLREMGWPLIIDAFSMMLGSSIVGFKSGEMKNSVNNLLLFQQ